MRVLILTSDIDTRGGIARYSATLADVLGDLIGPDNVHVLPLLRMGESGGSSTKYRLLDPVAGRLTAASKLGFGGKALGLGSRKYELIVCTHVALAPVAGLIRLVFGTPYWVTCHGRESWPPFPAKVRWALERADLILPVSRFTAETVSRVNGIPPNKMRVLYNAIPDDFVGMLRAANLTNSASTASNGKDRHILSVGRVTKENTYKGFDTVIRSLPKVRQAVPSVRYSVVGEGDDIERLKRLAVESGVQNHIDFKSGISDAELAACYRTCDVFVLPSRTARHNGGWHGEGFGRVYVEAALAGKPVVGSFGGGAAEAVLNERTGLLVDPESDCEVADALVMLLCNPELAAKMGQQGRHWAFENFTSGALSCRVSKLLSDYGFRFQLHSAKRSSPA